MVEHLPSMQEALSSIPHTNSQPFFIDGVAGVFVTIMEKKLVHHLQV